MTAAGVSHEDIARRLEEVRVEVHDVRRELEDQDDRLVAVEKVVLSGTREVRIVRRLAVGAIGASLASADPESLTGTVLHLLGAAFGL